MGTAVSVCTDRRGPGPGRASTGIPPALKYDAWAPVSCRRIYQVDAQPAAAGGNAWQPGYLGARQYPERARLWAHPHADRTSGTLRGGDVQPDPDPGQQPARTGRDRANLWHADYHRLCPEGEIWRSGAQAGRRQYRS